MRERIPKREPLDSVVHIGDAELIDANNERYNFALWRTLSLAIASTQTYGEDLPVGGIVIASGEIAAADFATDIVSGDEMRHAGYLAIMEASEDPKNEIHDLVTAIEPSPMFLDFLSENTTIRRVIFGFDRQTVADMGLVKEHSENIFQRIKRSNLPFRAYQMNDPGFEAQYGLLLNYVKRDVVSGKVIIDQAGLCQDLPQIMKLRVDIETIALVLNRQTFL